MNTAVHMVRTYGQYRRRSRKYAPPTAAAQWDSSVRIDTLAHLHSVGVLGDLRECRGLGRSPLPPTPPPLLLLLLIFLHSIPHTSAHHSLTVPHKLIGKIQDKQKYLGDTAPSKNPTALSFIQLHHTRHKSPPFTDQLSRIFTLQCIGLYMSFDLIISRTTFDCVQYNAMDKIVKKWFPKCQ